eukprot:TRINITY_DN21231_c0_g2_i1.p2 TRINITY_DN21231_c0_g2~~TRINITY_DN21231_c0_g2_i1.p2  ORF type:complete len:196 (+),score=51.22 TRINITY_DN21231_c0_g2_i1:1184-1771(+)
MLLFASLISESLWFPYKNSGTVRVAILWHIVAVVVLVCDAVIFDGSDVSVEIKGVYAVMMVLLIILALIVSTGQTGIAMVRSMRNPYFCTRFFPESHHRGGRFILGKRLKFAITNEGLGRVDVESNSMELTEVLWGMVSDLEKKMQTGELQVRGTLVLSPDDVIPRDSKAATEETTNLEMVQTGKPTTEAQTTPM